MKSSHRPFRSVLLPGLLLHLGGCFATSEPSAPPQPLALEEAEPEPEPEPFPADRVWTVRREVELLVSPERAIAIENPFTPLDVIGRDSAGLRVRCASCGDSVEGYVDEEDVVYTHLPPEISAWGDLAEFALSIRDAAARRDLGDLRPVMAPEFTFAFVGQQTPDDAFAVWRAEQFATLDRVPGLLDQGLATRDSAIWSAPPAFVHDLSYRDLRIGFRRRADGRWEWIYLIRGILGD